MARPFGTKYIESPEKMWEYFERYKAEVRANPIKVVEQLRGNVIVKGGEKITVPTISLPRQRPLTIEGFEIWCWNNEIISVLQDYFNNRDNRYADYVVVCSRIRKEVRNDQIEGGMAGIYNPSITQRLNNLVEKTDNNNTGDLTITVKYEQRDNDTTE